MSLVQLLDEAFGSHELWNRSRPTTTSSVLTNCQRLLAGPSVDLYPVEGGVELKADLPGMEKAEVDVSVDQNVLTLSGERKSEIDRDNENFHYAERTFGKFTRRVRLPYAADPSLVTATFVNGVLTVTIPQPEASRAGQINIE